MFCIALTSIYSEEISYRKAILKSAIVPGWGEASIGYKRGFVLMATEAFIWATNFYYSEESDLTHKESLEIANKYAGANISNNDKKYFDDVARYMSSNVYNDPELKKIKEEAENLPEADQAQYIIDESALRLYSDDLSWKWEIADHKYQYKVLRKDSLEYEDIAKAMIGVAVLNRAISCFDLLLIKKTVKNQNLDYGFRLDKKMNPKFIASFRF